MTTRVYKFGLLPPTENADRVRDLMLAAHQLRNQLVEIENNFRWALRLLTADLPEVEAVAAIDAQRLDLEARLLGARKVSGSRKPPSELVAERAQLKAASKEARALAKSARAQRATDPSFILALSELEERAKLLRKLAYEASYVGRITAWGTRALVTEAVKQSAATTPLHSNLRFRSVHGAKFHIGVTAPSAGAETFHQVVAASSSPGGRRGRAILRLRVGSDGGRAVFAEFPMTLHRSIPQGKIVQVTASLKMEANRERWTAEFTVVEADSKPEHGIGTVAVNVGWRQRPTGVRVLTCVDGEREWFVEMPLRIGEQLEKASSVRAIRDANQNKMAPAVLPALAASWIPWLPEAVAYAHAWRSHRRWHSLFLRLREAGLGDEFPALRDWYHQDLHLWQWEAAQRRKAVNSRNDFYRTVAAKLSTQYDTVLIAKSDRARAAMDKGVPDAAQHNRVQAATYDLELVILRAFRGRQGTIQVLPSENKTKTCHACGDVCEFDAARNLEHACEHCGAAWDQDINHCWNLREHFRESPGDAQTLGGARGNKPASLSKKRSDRAANAATKAEKLRAAREALGKAAE